ncbi:MAG: hypothetical protein ACTSPV_18220, partial [Candidatus Hodarchaeales archaeon]
MWETPIYRFRVPKGNLKGNKVIELTVDVTKSIPRGKAAYGHSKDLQKCLNNVLNDFKIKNVLEFGAGNLKNVIYLLRKGKSVDAVDFR